MALTCYCKKCGRDVPVGDMCPRCGAKLGRNTERVAWCIDHSPVRDWMTWNGPMRIILPVGALVLVLILVLEGIAGGWAGVEAMLRGGLVYTLLGLTLAVSAVLLLVFILQGDDVLDCVADSRGVHVQQYLPEPTPLKLLLRLRSPRMMADVDPNEEVPLLLVGQRDLAWKDVARVQLWPEKNMVLFYAPAWWMRVCLMCTPFTYEDVLDFVRDRIGSKKAVILPRELVVEKAPAKRRSSTGTPTFDQLRESRGAPEDFSDLSDVLSEIRAMNEEDQARPDA